jgi:hypothetical protein
MTQSLFDYQKNFFHSYENSRKFSFATFLEAHNPCMNATRQIDHRLSDYLQEMTEEHKDTVFIILSDHGNGHAPFGATWEGATENMAPLLSMVVPKWLLKQRIVTDGRSIEQHLLTNQRRLTTHYDVFKTISALIHWHPFVGFEGIKNEDLVEKTLFELNKESPGVNLFAHFVPYNRSCFEAGIQLIMCRCQHWEDVPTSELVSEAGGSPTLYELLGQKMVQIMNSLHQRGSSCIDLSFKSMDSAHVALYGQGRKAARIQFQTNEHERVFFAGVHYVEDVNQGYVDLKIEQLAQLSTYNIYNNCTDPTVRATYCVCGEYPPK